MIRSTFLKTRKAVSDIVNSHELNTTDRTDDNRVISALDDKFLDGNQTITIGDKSRPSTLTIIIIACGVVIAGLIYIFLVK